MQVAFQPLQQYLSASSTLFALQLVFFACVLINLLFALTHWFLRSEALTLPISVVLFYAVKLLSDASLTLDPPANFLWSDFLPSRLGLSYEQLFLANVDPYSGLVVLSLAYFTSVRPRVLRLPCVCFALASLFFLVFTDLTFQLEHSFSIFSAVVVALFSYIVAADLGALVEHRLAGKGLAEEPSADSGVELGHLTRKEHAAEAGGEESRQNIVGDSLAESREDIELKNLKETAERGE